MEVISMRFRRRRRFGRRPMRRRFGRRARRRGRALRIGFRM